MSDLFGWFQNYLNLSKLTAVSVPGMVVAFALILILGPIPCPQNTKSCPFCSANLKPPAPSASTITSYNISKGKITITAYNGFAAKDEVAISGATSRPELNGPWNIVAATSKDFTIAKTLSGNGKGKSLADGSGTETGTAEISKSSNAGSDTVIVSTTKWLPSVVVPRLESYTRPVPGSREDQDEKNLDAAIAQISVKCAGLPLYIVVGSRPEPAGKSKAVGASSSAGSSSDGLVPKKGAPQYADEQAVPYQILWADSYGCYGELAALDGWLQARIAQRQSLNTQEASDLSALSTSIASAQASGDRLVARDLSGQIAQKRSDLQNDQTDAKWITQAEAYVASLETQIKAMQTQLQNQITPAAAVPAPSTAGTVFQTIQQNFLMFLLFSLIIGQILDPIQRGLISFTGPRRNLFGVFNKVYGLNGDGEIRFGDRRLPPWTVDATYKPKISTELPMGRSSADLEYIDDMNIYDENYAIGAGFITQNEYRVIRDEYYSQSQITSGLILPLLMFSVSLGIRFICCSTAGSDVSRATQFIGSIFVIMLIGVAVGAVLSLLMSLLTSTVYAAIFKEFLHELGNQPGWIIVVITALIAVLFLFAPLFLSGNELQPAYLYFVMAPCILVFPLWLAGLDRLHEYYSKIQSRIAGNILRLQTNTEQKFVDLLSTAETRRSLKEKLAKSAKENDTLLKFLEGYLAKQDNPSSPQQGSDPPPTGL